MRRPWNALVITLALGGPTLAADARPYANARFGYDITLPRDFARATEADNGDGIATAARTGSAELRVWGAFGQRGSFRDEALDAIAADGSDGWTITYRRVTANGASWSGTRRGRIVYGRAIPLCEGAIATVRLDYAADERARYDGVVRQLVTSFRSMDCAPRTRR